MTVIPKKTVSAVYQKIVMDFEAVQPPSPDSYLYPGPSAYGWGAPSKPKPKVKDMDKNKLYNKPLLEAFPFLSSKKQEGEIGLEIECEGMNLFTAPISWWKTTVDHSLRHYKDHPPIEYVLRKAIPRGDVPKALNYLSRKLNEVGSDVVDSHRTSVHVHVNCQSLCFKEVIQFWSLYAIFEELLVEFSGPDREGNLFCLRAKDAEHFIQVLESGLQQGDYDEIFSKDLRYTACNMASVGKFGSLEFRSMRGTVDKDLIQLWIDILLLIRDKALEYSDPQEIVKDYEKYGPEVFLKKVMSSREDIYLLLSGMKDYKNRMWDGLRLMRDVAYAINWEKRDEGLVPKKADEETEANQKVSPVLNQSLNHDVEPQKVKEGVWIEYDDGKFWLINYNPYIESVSIGITPWGVKARRAYHIDTVTGKYLDSQYVLAYGRKEPDSPQSPPLPEDENENVDVFSEPEEENDDY